jgi:ATP-dependent RNA helicase SUPV3L1/SUV3
MSDFARAPLTAILGPTNTGKTFLAVERMAAHSSGMIGFPLRLLAREVYDRVVKMKGANQVALITGEEKILPRDARWFLCTAESMPMERDFAFVALDEAQLGADPERGHVFTDRMLHARGREETMILGSEALAPMVRALLPKAEIIGRPRFSDPVLRRPDQAFRLPPRSAIVAFLRGPGLRGGRDAAPDARRRGGGDGRAFPRTRNAQVAMYQAGEVDYLVATDAIGMGLNMDVSHVAFAGLSKFDGRRRRADARRNGADRRPRRAPPARRHLRRADLRRRDRRRIPPEEIEAIEEHRFAPLEHLYWREGDPDFRSVEALIRSLERRPTARARAAPEAIDLAVLKRLAEDPEIASRPRG